MDPFGAAYWNQLQAVLWICTRSRVVVRLAVNPRSLPRDLDDNEGGPAFDEDLALIAGVVIPGGCVRKRLRSHRPPDCPFEDAEQTLLDALGKDRLRATGLRNGDGDREPIPQEQWTDLQFQWAPPAREFHGRLPPVLSRSRRYVGPRDPLRRNASFWTDVLLEREAVLVLWADPIWRLPRAKAERPSLAEAVAILIRERPASRRVWTRLRRRCGGRFPATVQERIEDAGRELVGLLQRGEIAATGYAYNRDQGSGRIEAGRKLLDDMFLNERLWVDPCADGVWTEPGLSDGRFNVHRGYRDVVLKLPKARVAREEERPPAAHEHVGTASVIAPADRSQADNQIGPSSRTKRKGGRSARWVPHLKKYLRLRVDKGDCILSDSLTQLRSGFLSYANHHAIRSIPRSRSWLDEQIKKVRVQVAAGIKLVDSPSVLPAPRSRR